MVDKIKKLCKIRGISIYKLEKNLGFGNGTIGKWEKGVPNYARIKAVADYFSVPVSDLTGEQKKEPPAQGGEHMDPVTRELMEFAKTASEEEKKAALEMINLILKQRGNK